MELSAIWYIAAIAANTAVIILAGYAAVLTTVYYIERCISDQPRPKRRKR